MDANIKYKKKNLNKAYFKILSNSMLFDCFYLAPSGRQSPHDLLLGIPGLGAKGVMGGAEESWLDSGPMEGLRLGWSPRNVSSLPPLMSASRAARGPKCSSSEPGALGFTFSSSAPRSAFIGFLLPPAHLPRPRGGACEFGACYFLQTSLGLCMVPTSHHPLGLRGTKGRNRGSYRASLMKPEGARLF